MNVPSVEPIQAHCPECDGERTCKVHGSIEKPWSYEDRQGNSTEGGVTHSLLECMGCHTVFYETSSWSSEDVDQWYDAHGETQGEYVRTKVTYPKPDSRTKPIWFDDMYKIDNRLHGILSEMYVAYDNELYVLTAIGLRTALDRGTEVLGIDPAISFEGKLTALKEGGWIGETEKDILGVVTDAGNTA